MAKLNMLVAAVVLMLQAAKANNTGGIPTCESFFIKNRSTGKCIDVEGYPALGNGHKLQTWDCEFNKPLTKVDQYMRVDIFNRVQSRISGKCFDVEGSRPSNNGAKIQIWECESPDNNNNDHVWDFVYHGNTRYFQIKNRYTHKCVDVQGWSDKGNGKRIQQWDCESFHATGNGRPSDQWWYITGVNPREYTYTQN